MTTTNARGLISKFPTSNVIFRACRFYLNIFLNAQLNSQPLMLTGSSLKLSRQSFVNKLATNVRTFYDSQTRKDTIFAPSTSINPSKGSPLGVVRISGPRTQAVIKQLTSKRLNDDDTACAEFSFIPRRATLAKIFSPDKKELIDIGILLWFPGPNSYTGEDVGELHLHGSKAILTKTLDVLGKLPQLRPAEPGEFTRRAVLNGRMSLMQAESLPELISSQTDQQRRLALAGLSGVTRNKYDSWKQDLTNILAHLEASIDFGEDELLGEKNVVSDCILKIRKLTAELSEFIIVSNHCRELVKGGARATILGSPNVGKSTFMNILCHREKSIVSDLSGTTRDVVEHCFELGGHTVTLCDTAGLKQYNDSVDSCEKTDDNQSILEKHDQIEREGIKRALASARTADLIIYLIDGSELCSLELDRKLDKLARDITKNLESLSEDASLSREKTIRIVINKIDLTANNDKLKNNRNYVKDHLIGSMKRYAGNLADSTQMSVGVDFISCKTGENLSQLLENIKQDLDNILAPTSGDCSERNQFDFVNERHTSLLISTKRHLQTAGKLELRNIDEMAQHVRESVDYLSRIVGEVTNEQVLDIVFRDFCIGK